MRAIQRLENFRRKPLRDKWFAVKATLKRFAVKATHVQLGRGVRRATNRVYVTLNDRHVRRQIFREIYEGGLWGSDAHSKFFSGVGSRGKCAELYVAKMVQLLREHAAELGRPLTVVDLGCGDFQIGRALLAELPDFDYVGCDIVPQLVEHNNRVYANEHVKFCQLDIVSEALPVGDVCLVRQVLQHLPNADIQKFLQKAIFPYLYVTEGQPSVRVGPFNPDINTGVGLRFDWLSGRGRGVELDKPPYCLKTQEAFRTSERVNEIIVTERIFVGEAGLPLANRRATFLPPTAVAGIPPLIFQTWKSKIDFPHNFSFWKSTFDIKNPYFQHMIWDDDDNRSFIASYFPWFLEIYDSYPRELYRADAVRYFFLYTFGGFYADMDVECLRPLDNLRHRGDVLVGRMGGNPQHAHSIPNATMASKPRQEFWLLVIRLIMDAAKDAAKEEPEDVTGPVILKTAVDLYLSQDQFATRVKVKSAIRSIADRLAPELRPTRNRCDVQILPHREWYAVDWTDPIHRAFRQELFEFGFGSLDDARKQQLFPESSVVSYWTHFGPGRRPAGS